MILAYESLPEPPHRHLVSSRAQLSKIAHNFRRIWLRLQHWLWLCRCFEFFLSCNSILARRRDILDALGCMPGSASLS